MAELATECPNCEGKGILQRAEDEDHRKWLEVFLLRFFEFSQFKRSALPNAPKVGSGGSLSPRGDWRAPSDAKADVWLQELELNVPHQLGHRREAGE